MDTLRFIELYYNVSPNDNWKKKGDSETKGNLLYHDVLIDIFPYANPNDPYHSVILDPKGCLDQSIFGNKIIVPDLKHKFYQTLNLANLRGSFQINPIFEYVIRHNCFKQIFESRDFLEIALNRKNQTFFEDKWFLKAFLKLENWFDRHTLTNYSYYRNDKKYFIKEKYDRISKEIDFMPVEVYDTLRINLKISKSFISKSTIKSMQNVFNNAFDIFARNVWLEYEHHNKLPF